MGASGSTINVGLQGLQGNLDQDGDKTQTCTQHGGHFGSTLLAGGACTGRTLPIGPRNSGGSDQAADGWVDAVVATPLFPNGRPPGADRLARHQKRVSKFRVFSDGVVFEGPEAASMDAHDLSRGYERLMGRVLTRVMVGDKRAQQVLVAYADGRFWAVPSRQIFSRHLGVCLILGDKTVRGVKHTLQVGDIIRVGSVGLLVSEINSGVEGTEKQVVSQDVLNHIREDISTAPTQVLAPLREQFETGKAAEEGGRQDAAAAANDEDDDDDFRTSVQCYICMDESESEEDALIAPCQCKGSTALVHVRCLQRLLSTGDAHKTNVVSTRHESHTCKICKARYKTHVKLKDGTLIPLLNPTLAAPSLTLIVVTRHDPHPDLFNNIFQLSFARTSELSLGRSQACDVVIGYRTVSTRHATISYSRGEFYYQDNRSSNGSLLYLRAPLELPFNRAVRLRMGRSVLTLRARKTLQLSTLPRRTALDAIRWVSSLTRRSGGGGGGGSSSRSEEESSVSESSPPLPPSQVTGAELLRRLFEGELEDQRDRSIDEAIEQMNLMAWSMADDSSSSGKSGNGEEEEGDDDEGGDGQPQGGGSRRRRGQGPARRRHRNQQLQEGGGGGGVDASPSRAPTSSRGGGDHRWMRHNATATSGAVEGEDLEALAATAARGAWQAPGCDDEIVDGPERHDADGEKEDENGPGNKYRLARRGRAKDDGGDDNNDGGGDEDDTDVRRGGGGRPRYQGREGGAATATTSQQQQEMKQADGEEGDDEDDEDDDEDMPPEAPPRFLPPCSRSETGPPTSARPFLHRTRSSVV